MNIRRLTMVFAVLALVLVAAGHVRLSSDSAAADPNEIVFEGGGWFLPGCELKVQIVSDSTAVYTPSSESSLHFRGPWPVRAHEVTLYTVARHADGDIDESLTLTFNDKFLPVHYRFSNARAHSLSPLLGPKDCNGLRP